ncbi:lipopolysaccharide transport periplasmic protein LptA [Halomonas halocynthiae]|uniref:lipopolysaccharide transport periplasmic protein LptA n=1 Tax=Halomonas halocynthiae TaxID=176290 RepID=UPI0004138A3C|nr:lipopolysaccharide transport periplasmic protein LptA [Halomonas halocynthiae]
MIRLTPSTMLAGLLAVTLLSANAHALESDASAPVQVEADRFDLDNLAGSATYQGDVRIRQGTMKLNGDRVELYRNADGKLSRAVAVGNRAYIEQQPSPEEKLMKGWAKRIVYHVAERRVELIDEAELHQGNDTFDGGFLEYFLDRRVVQARSTADGVKGSQRVRMTLEPEQQGGQ